MTLEEYIKVNNFPKVRKLGKIKGVTYYIENNITDNEDVGIPFVIQEIGDKFSVCTSDESLYAIDILIEENQ